MTEEEFAHAAQIAYSADVASLKDANFYIVTVPTPVDQAKRPDLSALVAASHVVGTVLSPGNVVVYESTVFPGATEEVCVPQIEKASGLAFNRDFFAGYSPERINPGDKTHRLPSIVKVTSGSTPEAADLVDAVYAKVITAGTHRASSIRVAEAAKVIENIQRDVNIALINELAMLFKQLGLETREVLEAAGTKWNFQPYRPGLVGGHCIGVDPYYLTYKAESIGFHPQMILAGRRINDAMAAYVANDVIKIMLKRKQSIDQARVLVMGFTFKENVPDTRNTKVVDLVRTLRDFVAEVVVYDPMADVALAKHEYGIDLTNDLPHGPFDAIILAVKHEAIAKMGEAWDQGTARTGRAHLRSEGHSAAIREPCANLSTFDKRTPCKAEASRIGFEKAVQRGSRVLACPCLAKVCGQSLRRRWNTIQGSLNAGIG